jgi:hypothetical protein
VPCIAGEVIEESGTARIAGLFFDDFDTAEHTPGLLPRRVRVDAGRDQPFGLAIDVIAQLLVELGFLAVAKG